MRSKEGWLNALRLLLLCAAAVMVAVGISRGEVAMVLKKAINLCLECIGLG
ncbi:MAG: thioredoxin [Clostridiales bacterium]|nr:thioredoxin [Clostridiales bacterium]